MTAASCDRGLQERREEDTGMNRMHREDGAASPNNVQFCFSPGTARHTGMVSTSERQRHCHISPKKSNKIPFHIRDKIQGMRLQLQSIAIIILPTEQVGSQSSNLEVRYLVLIQRGEGVCSNKLSMAKILSERLVDLKTPPIPFQRYPAEVRR